MAANRSAGYCSNCNRGVSIVKSQPTGFMNKMRSALQQTDGDSDWVCTKCGQPATRGFAPKASEVPAKPHDEPATETAPIDTFAIKAEPAVQPEKVESPATEGRVDTRNCPACAKANPARAEKCSFCNQDMNLPPGQLEATCHLCNKPIDFKNESAGQQVSCPSCHQTVVLPELVEDSSALTKAPPILKLDDDPDRPEVSKALCTQCNLELTYPRRLAGKYVDCPSCAEKFTLP